MTTDEDELALLQRQLERERLARSSAEEIGERTTRELYELTVSLRRTNEQLEEAKGRLGTLAQEPWFRTTLWSLGDAVIATDAEARVRFMNPVASALTGWPADEAEGRPIDEVFQAIAEETRAPVPSPVAAVLRDGVVLAIPERSVLVGRGGEEHAIDDSVAPIVRGGRNDGVVVVFRDVTAARREVRRRRFLAEATRILASSLERGESLERLCALAVPHYAQWCVVYTWQGDQLEVEAVGHADPGQRARLREEHPGLPLATRVASTRAPELTAGAAGEPHQIAAPITHDESVLGALVLSSNLGVDWSAEDLELAGELALRVGIALRHAQLYEDAVRADRFKDALLSGLSYELRTPLTAILGWLQICKRDPENVELVRKTLDIAERNARAEAELIASLLDVSDVLAGEVVLQPQRVDATDFARAAVEATRPAAEAKGVALAFDGGPPCSVDADPDRLHQVISNLVGNALTFTQAGGRVEVSTQCDAEGVHLTVRDTGVGIDPAFLPHVFDAFRKWDPSLPRRPGRGPGIGLAIARRLVELHHGRITAGSEGPGRGARFDVILPTPTGTGRVVPAPSVAPRLEGLRVLVVDDHLDNRDLVAELLTEAGARVQTAASVEEALERLSGTEVDTIVTDIAMPGLDGYDLLARVRETSSVPVIALTALASAAEARRLSEHGFAKHIKKPVDPDALVAAVAAHAPRAPAGEPS